MKHTKAHLPRIRRVLCRTLCLALCLALCLPLSACADQKAPSTISGESVASNISSSENSPAETPKPTEAPKTEEPDTAEPTPAAEATTQERYNFTFEKTVLYDKNDIVITATKNKSAEGFEISLILENNSDKDYDIMVYAMAINGIMTDCNQYTMNTSVPSGKKANGALLLDNAWFDNNGIQDISNIDVLFWAYDQSSNIKDFETDIASIKTNHFNAEKDKAELSDVEVYKNKGVLVYSLGDTTFLVKNDSNSYYHYDLINFSVNGWAYDVGISVFDKTVFPNCLSIFDVAIKDEFLQENGINKITDIEFNLDIKPLGDLGDKYSTDKITVTLPKD